MTDAAPENKRRDGVPGSFRLPLQPGQRQRPPTARDLPDMWRSYFEARAEMASSGGAVTEKTARAKALHVCVMIWLNAYPPATNAPDGDCPHCAKPLDETARPFLVGNGHNWLHDRCHAPWQARRHALAVAALAAMGIDAGEPPPPDGTAP